jgi:hypothetical protein
MQYCLIINYLLMYLLPTTPRERDEELARVCVEPSPAAAALRLFQMVRWQSWFQQASGSGDGGAGAGGGATTALERERERALRAAAAAAAEGDTGLTRLTAR